MKFVKTNISGLIAKAMPDRLKEIEAAVNDGRAETWSIDDSSAARAYLDRIHLSLDRDLEKELQKPLKITLFPSFLRSFPKGTTASEILSVIENMKDAAVHAASEEAREKVFVPSLKAKIKMKVIDKVVSLSKKIIVRDIPAASREKVPVLVRSRY